MKLNRNGVVNTSALLLFVTVILLVITLIFAVWAYSGRQKYKNNVSSIVSSSVKSAVAAQQALDTSKFNAQQQSSLTTYNGPTEFGSIILQYPKNWSAYVNSSSNSNSSSNPLDAYFMPNILTSVTDDGTINFALRMQVEGQSYNTTLQQYDNQSGITVAPYALPKVPNDVGVKISGQLQNNINGTLIILPLRSQALEIWTEGSNNLSTFNSIILPNLSFSP